MGWIGPAIGAAFGLWGASKSASAALLDIIPPATAPTAPITAPHAII